MEDIFKKSADNEYKSLNERGENYYFAITPSLRSWCDWMPWRSVNSEQVHTFIQRWATLKLRTSSEMTETSNDVSRGQHPKTSQAGSELMKNMKWLRLSRQQAAETSNSGLHNINLKRVLVWNAKRETFSSLCFNDFINPVLLDIVFRLISVMFYLFVFQITF